MKKKTLMHVFFIVIVCVIVYGNSFLNDFVWDDEVFIADNMKIRSIKNIPSFFTEAVFGIYRPVRTIWYSIMYKIWGMNVFGYHLNSLVLHILTSVLVYLIVNELSNKSRIALISALLFASHPMHTERVTNITGSFDMIGILLMLFAFYLYIRSRDDKNQYVHSTFRVSARLATQSESSKIIFCSRRLHLVLCTYKNQLLIISSLAIYAAALFASEEAATLPIVLILYDLCFKRGGFKNFLRLIPYFGLLSCYLFVRFFLLDIVERQSMYHGGSLFFTLLTMTKVVVKYVYWLVLPINNYLYPSIELAKSVFDLKVILSSIFILLLIGYGIMKHKKSPLVSFGIGFFFITLGPFSNILPIQVLHAQRYLYLPSLGFCIIMGLVFDKLFHKRKLFYLLLAGILLFYSAQTIDRNTDWKNNLILWNDTVQYSALSPTAHTNLGYSYELNGDTHNAILEYQEAVKLDPNHEKAYYNLGVIFARTQEYDKALEKLNNAIKINPEYDKAYTSRGLVYYTLGRLDLAINDYKKAISINPYSYKAYNNLGLAYAQQGQIEDAVLNLKKAIEINPGYSEADSNLKTIYKYYR